MLRYLLCPLLLAVAAFPAGMLISEDKPTSTEPVHHALVQKKVGFYAVYLPPDYAANSDKTYPVCVILHGHGSSETGHGGLSNSLGREGVIYVAPRAGHVHKGLLAQGRRGYTAWPTYPESWGEWDSETFPKDDVEKLQVQRLYTDWISDCVADVRERYRTDGQRVVVVGHSQGAMFSMTLALHRPELVRAHFAYAGAYWSEVEDDIAAQTLKKHDIYSYIAHCDDDQVVSSDSSRKLVEYFKEHDVKHDSLFVERGGHSFTSKISRAAQEFIAKWCRDEELPPLEGKLVVTEVVEDSQASQAGLKAGDVLVSYSGKAITNMDELQAAIAAAEADGKDSIEIIWKRGEEEMKAAVKPGRLGVHLADR